MRAPGALRAVLRAGRELGFALVALVMWYGLGAELVPGIAVWILILLGPVVSWLANLLLISLPLSHALPKRRLLS